MNPLLLHLLSFFSALNSHHFFFPRIMAIHLFCPMSRPDGGNQVDVRLVSDDRLKLAHINFVDICLVGRYSYLFLTCLVWYEGRGKRIPTDTFMMFQSTSDM